MASIQIFLIYRPEVSPSKRLMFLHGYLAFQFTMRLSSLPVFFALAATTQGAALPSSHVVHERRTQPMQTWVKRDRLSPKAVLPMRVGLTQRNLERVDEYLMDV